MVKCMKIHKLNTVSVWTRSFKLDHTHHLSNSFIDMCGHRRNDHQGLCQYEEGEKGRERGGGEGGREGERERERERERENYVKITLQI